MGQQTSERPVVPLVGGEPRPKGATVGKGEPGIIAQCVERPDGPLEPTNGLTRHARHSYGRMGSEW
jgi:hypothetical protein